MQNPAVVAALMLSGAAFLFQQQQLDPRKPPQEAEARCHADNSATNDRDFHLSCLMSGFRRPKLELPASGSKSLRVLPGLSCDCRIGDQSEVDLHGPQ